MTTIERYNRLDKKVVSRQEIQELLSKAIREKEKRVVAKLQKLLKENDNTSFDIQLTEKLTPLKKKVARVSRHVKRAKNKPSRVTTKTKTKLKVYGLAMPMVVLKETRNIMQYPEQKAVVHNAVPIPKEKHPVKPIKNQRVLPGPKGITNKKARSARTMADLSNVPLSVETFKTETAIGDFLGGIEKKPKGSVVVTLDAPAGSGKTRFLFQTMEAYANAGKRSVFVTLEEHSASQLFIKKRDQYISSSNFGMITIIDADDINTYNDLLELLEEHDIAFIDSFGKLQKLIKEIKMELDTHLRNAVDGKLIFSIFQRTKDGKMRGGADAEFDADVILEVEKPSKNYQDNYVIARKNRYNEKPSIKYNIYHQRIIDDSEEEMPNRLPEARNKLAIYSLE